MYVLQHTTDDLGANQLNFASRRASTPVARVETTDQFALFTIHPSWLLPPPLPPRPSLPWPIRRGYDEGEQVYISYGRKSNDELLQFYGFVEADCLADTFVVVCHRRTVSIASRPISKLCSTFRLILMSWS